MNIRQRTIFHSRLNTDVVVGLGLYIIGLVHKNQVCIAFRLSTRMFLHDQITHRTSKTTSVYSTSCLMTHILVFMCIEHCMLTTDYSIFSNNFDFIQVITSWDSLLFITCMWFVVHTCREANCGYICYCLFVWFLCACMVTISPWKIWLKASMVGNLPFWELCSNQPARPCCNMMLLGFCDSHAYQVRAACGRRIGMCGYMSVPEDGWTCLCMVDYFYTFITHAGCIAAGIG